jgi:opacity protein-like surface antigen
MVKKLLLSLIGMLTILTAQSQDSPQVKPQASAPYKLAVGLRYTVGAGGYTDLGLTGKYFVTDQSALEAYVMIPSNSRDFLASLSYVWQPKLGFSERFRPYAGAGAGILRHTDWPLEIEGKPRISPIAFGMIGIEYQFKKLPMALSLDYRTPMLSTGANAPHSNHISRFSSLSVGLKYTFR